MSETVNETRYLGDSLQLQSVVNPMIKYDSSMLTYDGEIPYLSNVTDNAEVYSVMYGYATFTIPKDSLCGSNTHYSDKTFQELIEAGLNEIKINICMNHPSYGAVFFEKTVNDISNRLDSNGSYNLGSYYIPIPVYNLSNILSADKIFNNNVGGIFDNSGDGIPYGGAVNISNICTGNGLTGEILYSTESFVYSNYFISGIDPGGAVLINDILKSSDSEYNGVSAYDYVKRKLSESDDIEINVCIDDVGLNDYTIVGFGYTVGSSVQLGTSVEASEWEWCDHEWVLTETVEATCSNEGYNKYICANCGKIKQEVIPKTEHTSQYKYYIYNNGLKAVNKSSYDSYTGCKYYDEICSVCGDILNEKVEVIHTDVVDIAPVFATCETNGNTAGKQCEACKTILSGYEIIPPTGHKWTEERVEPSRKGHDPGYTKKTCDYCGQIVIEYDNGTGEPNHTWVKIDSLSEEPTCTESGYDFMRCFWYQEDGNGCNETKIEEVPALGHSWIRINYKPATYTEEGYTGDVVCSRSGCDAVQSLGEPIPKLAETVRYTSADGKWEKIGVSDVDLSNYCTKSELNTAVSSVEYKIEVLAESKQDRLTAGNGINAEDNVLSVDTGLIASKEYVDEAIASAIKNALEGEY